MYYDKKVRSVYAGAHHAEENILPVFAGLLRIQAGIVLFLVLEITKLYEVWGKEQKLLTWWQDE